jgi:hypothetical protein
MIDRSILLEPVAQDARYHDFADRRTLLGIPNFWNVISNVAFLIVGIAGLRAMRAQPMDRAYLVFFLGLVFVSFGSAWYHLAPDNSRLTWDRLPMTLVFMAFLAIVIGECIDPRLSRRWLPFLVLAGVTSVIYWHFSERRGRGDLRPYLLVQFFPLVLIPLIMLWFSPPQSKGWTIWGTLVAYVAAKILELFDERIFRLHEVISGHTLKHLVAAPGAYFLLPQKSQMDLMTLDRCGHILSAL